ncbi:MAG: hypothetical protein D4R67_08670 [Bacteroidetes bacterium]|nr:MAG: hypothetical protein D4R67_08670 [Bacteroidota bacterium]
MNPDSNPWNELDALILETLKEKPERELPLTFTDTLLRKVERQLTWRELVREFAVKTGIVTGTLLVLILCLILPVRETTNPFLLLLADHWKIVSGVIFLILFTFFSDQVLLKFYTKQRLLDTRS